MPTWDQHAVTPVWHKKVVYQKAQGLSERRLRSSRPKVTEALGALSMNACQSHRNEHLCGERSRRECQQLRSKEHLCQRRTWGNRR